VRDSDDANVNARVIGDKAISPDETQIAFILGEGYNDNSNPKYRLYISNIDGTNMHLLATTYNDENPLFVTPIWSPDGRWIMVSEGYRKNAPGSATEGYLYLIPTEDLSKTYYVSKFGGDQKSPEVRFFWRYTSSGYLTNRSSTTYTLISDPY
jgi:Tol biopolymer transport system component